MKKIIYISLILFLSVFIFQGVSKAAGPFETIQYCDPARGYMISEAAKHVYVRYINQFYPEHKDICLTFEIGAIQEDTSNYLHICPRGYIIPKKNDAPSDDSDKGCCPSGYKYFYDKKGSGTDFCLPDTSIPKDSVIRETLDCSSNTYNAVCPILCGTGAGDDCGPPIDATRFPVAYADNTKYFFPSEQKVVCNDPNCIYSGANKYEETKGGPYSLSEVLSLTLVCTADSEALGDHTCARGNWYPTSDYEKWKDNLGVFLTCNDFSTLEKDTCLTCYDTCSPTGTCSYSSLGCIQTTQNGVIVRIFQIGLGVVGALAIARFIQAALLRQTADPSKIQESYDIITSLIIGIVVLLGSTVILRFIGVDILQMLPF